jgi:hypothetical protein
MRISLFAPDSDLPSIGNGIVSRGLGAVNSGWLLREASGSEEQTASATFGCQLSVADETPEVIGGVARFQGCFLESEQTLVLLGL